MDYLGPVRNAIRATPGTDQGIIKIISASFDAVGEIDAEIVDLLEQRERLVEINVHYSGLHKIVVGHDPAIEAVPGLPDDTKSPDTNRKRVLNIANAIAEGGDHYVTDDAILTKLTEQVKRSLDSTTMSWANPRAVIGTILIRSGKWVKEEPGVYTRKSDKGKEPEDLPF